MRLTSPPPRPAVAPRGGSPFRLLAGVVLVIAALTFAAFGFSRLVTLLDSGGYGTPPMRLALALLGVAGACLSAGIATLIWDIAKRYEQ